MCVTALGIVKFGTLSLLVLESFRFEDENDEYEYEL